MENKPKKIILHCSATPDERDIGVKEITEWHITRGWKTCGYHWVIRRNGLPEAARPESVQGAHAYGHNKDSISICLVGELRFNGFQMTTLVELLLEITERHGILTKNIICHNEVTSYKTCPNFSGPMIRKLIYYALK